MANQRDSDELLWDAVVTDSDTAFSVLFDRYWSVTYKTAFSYLKDREQSEEITHDIFLNLWQRRHALSIQSFSAYLRASARYHVYKHLKSARSNIVDYTDDWETMGGAPSAGNDGEQRILQAEFEHEVEAYLVDLPARCREIFLLSRRDDLSNQEIADRLGISKRSVENQLTRALKHLRGQLKTLCIGVAITICTLLAG